MPVPEIIARLSVGAAVHDGTGSVMVAAVGGGFAVFVYGGTLPGGEAEVTYDDLSHALVAAVAAFDEIARAYALTQNVSPMPPIPRG